MSKKAVIIGVGSVGATLAFTLAQQSSFNEIVLIDKDKKKAQGHAMDIAHAAMYLNNVEVRAGDYSEIKDSYIVILTAGAKQHPGQSRTELLDTNVAIFKTILAEVKKYINNQILIVVSNPVDVLTFLTIKTLNYDTTKVFGTGTSLDTSRFRYLIGKKQFLSPTNVHAYILGEHGDSSVPITGNSNVSKDQKKLENLYLKTKNAAYEVIESKGATYYAIAVVASEIIKSVVRNEYKIYPLSIYQKDYAGVGELCLSLPCVVCYTGINRVMEPTLTFGEKKLLINSAKVIKNNINKL